MRKFRQRAWKPSERYPTRESYLQERGRRNKQTGIDGEFALASELRELGFQTAKKGSEKDIIGTQPFHVECKHVRSSALLGWMWQAIKDSLHFRSQGYYIPTVWMKHNDNWYVMVPVSHLWSFCTNMLKIIKPPKR